MHILTVLYGHPDDPEAFDKHYEQTHVPLVDSIPGLQSWTHRHVASMDDNPPPYYLIAELTFDSLESLQAGMGSAEGQAAAGDVPNFASGGATMMVAHD
jgi:uncharacterized protein (TIGR02118 family)